MPSKKTAQPDSDSEQRPSILSALFSKREKKDKDYLPDLKGQWGSMQGKDRFLFVLGGLLGLMIFAGAIILVYILITAIAGIAG